MKNKHLIEMARRMRFNILKMAHECGSSSHLGGGLSIVEILAGLYGEIMQRNKDRFILSKGHGVLGYYAALHEIGLISYEDLNTFQKNDSALVAHPVMNGSIGIETSNGSLGHGLSLGIGIALAAKKRNKNSRVFVLMGNGECNEGQVWEAAMLASHLRLDNLIAIIDDNGLQSDGVSSEVLDVNDISRKWTSFGFDTKIIDGHDIDLVCSSLHECGTKNIPSAVIAKTVKGKGISFMENNNDWHHGRLTSSLYEQALKEMEL